MLSPFPRSVPLNGLAAVQLARYRVALEARALLDLPGYLGSTLRGAFGHAFRRVACAAGTGGDCLSPEACPYHLVFETSPPPDAPALRSLDDLPRPFVIAPPRSELRAYPAGSSVSFDLTLIGRARDFFPWFVLALNEVTSIGRRRQPVVLKRLEVNHPLSGPGACVYSDADRLVRTHNGSISLADCLGPAPAKATLRFLTWTRLKHDGMWARRPEFHILFRRLLGRLSSLAAFHCGARLDLDFAGLIEEAKRVRLAEDRTRWDSWSRYSSRQRRSMDLGGLIGAAVYEGDLEPFWPFLLFGQWTHVGKNATFGLGRYELVEVQEEVA
jgi:hypothetical protein